MYSVSISTPTPTVKQFFSATGAITAIRFKDYQKLNKQGDLQLVPNSYHENLKSGLSVATYKTPNGQYIISYNGTTGLTASGFNLNFFKAQVRADQIASNNQVGPAEREAADYASAMADKLESQGVCRDDIFVTGYSLGGILSQYAAQQTGLAGIGFEGTGIPKDPSKEDKGNFISIASYGDAVPALSSDVKGLQPLAPRYDRNGGSLPHNGSLAILGNPALQPLLHIQGLLGQAALNITGAIFGPQAKQILHDKNVLPMVILNGFAHDPSVVAKELGIERNAGPLMQAINKLIPNPVLKLSPHTPGTSGNQTLPELAQHLDLRH